MENPPKKKIACLFGVGLFRVLKLMKYNDIKKAATPHEKQKPVAVKRIGYWLL